MIDLIHQTLHGYQNGHKLISSTIELTPAAKNILLRESDSPGEDFHHQDTYCYSGYPVIAVGAYVLSKTWVATEINRPGCVWTHSLLIPFSLLAKKEGIECLDLESIFLSKKCDFFNLSLSPIHASTLKRSTTNKDLTQLFSEIFSEDKQTILNVNSVSINDIANIWGRLWPKMRRCFSFKTWSPKKIFSSSNYNQYDLVLSNHCDGVFRSEKWGSEFFNPESPLHEFNWKYGASLDEKKSNVFNLYNVWGLYNDIDDDSVIDFVLRWGKCPVSLVKDIINNYSSKPITLKLSYLISKYILTLDESVISLNKVSAAGKIICLQNNDFFLKVIKSTFPLKKSYVSEALHLLSRRDIASLLNESLINIDQVNYEEALSCPDFWDFLNDKEAFLKLLIHSGEISKITKQNIIDKLDLVELDKFISLPIVVFNFNSDRKSHKTLILNNVREVIDLINESATVVNSSLSDFILEEYEVNELLSLSDNSISSLWLNSGKETKYSIKILQLICLDTISPRPISLEEIFNDLLNKSIEYRLYYSEMTKIRREIKTFLKATAVIHDSLMHAFSQFVITYMNFYNLPLSKELEGSIKKVKPSKYNTKKTYNFFWF